MKKALLIVLIVLVGVGVFFYPNIADYFSNKNASVAVQDYTAAINQTDEDKLQAALKAAQDYNSQLTGQGIHDPFIPGSGTVLGANYLSLLDLSGDEIMGYLTIPKINVDLPIYHGSDDATLQKGVGHLVGTSLPVGGPTTHAVLTGHTGLSNAVMFTNLTQLVQGDTFYIHVLNEVLAYQVDQIKIVQPNNTEDLLPVPGKDYVTLITCTPYGINSERLLVRGERIPYSATQEAAAKTAKATWWTPANRELFIAAVCTALIMLGLILFAVFYKRKKDKKEVAVVASVPLMPYAALPTAWLSKRSELQKWLALDEDDIDELLTPQKPPAMDEDDLDRMLELGKWSPLDEKDLDELLEDWENWL